MARMGNENKKKETNPLQEAFDKSVEKISYEYGLPKAYVENQIDKEKLGEYINKYASTAAQTFGKDYKLETDPNFIPEIKKYLLSGEAFSEQLKKAGSLEESLTKTSYDHRSFAQKFKDWFIGKRVEEQDYKKAEFDPINNLAGLFESDPNYQRLMPSVAQGLSLGAQAKYGNQIVKVAYANNLIDEEKARKGIEDSYKIMKKSKELVGKGIENYLTNLSKIAAGIFGVLGVLVLMMQMQFTGAVVGTNLNNSWGIYYGLGLILISLVMFVLLKNNLINEPLEKSKKRKVKNSKSKLKKSKVKSVKSKSTNKTKQHKNKKPTSRKIKKIKRRK